MTEEIIKTEDDFDKLYTYDESVQSVSEPEKQAGCLETFGHDIEILNKIMETRPNNVWTMLDCDEGMYIVPGRHYVNRLYYVVTNEEVQGDFEDCQFRVMEYDEEGNIVHD